MLREEMRGRDPSTAEKKRSIAEAQQPKAAPVVLLFANFGLYHLARLSALRSICDTHAVEFAVSQELYGWSVSKDIAAFTTLFNGSVEQSSRAELFASCVRLWRLLNKISPGHVFIPGYMDVRAIIAALWARIYGAQSILMFESTERDKPRNVIIELLKTWLIRLLFSHAFVGGIRSKQYAEKLKVPSGKIVTKYDVVDNSFFSAGVARIKMHSTAGQRGLPQNYFLFVARLAVEKNASGLITAFSEYRSRGGTWELVIVGRGSQETALKTLLSVLNLQGLVHFVGFKNAEELWPFYAFAQCLVLPSKKEPWGLVVNEAMASGLPVIVSDACGCVEDLVQENANGYMFKANDEHDLAAQLCKIASLTAEMRNKMGRRSEEIISRYSPSDWAQSARQLLSGR
jgi:1,2-diacylglycerol 3-alpha-glucosyltransferase